MELAGRGRIAAVGRADTMALALGRDTGLGCSQVERQVAGTAGAARRQKLGRRAWGLALGTAKVPQALGTLRLGPGTE